MIVWDRLVNSALISFERFPWKLSPEEAVVCHRCHSVSCQPLVFLRHPAGQDDGWRGQIVVGEEPMPNALNIPSDCINVSIVKPSRCTIFRVYWIWLYMLRTVFPSIIRSSRLYIQHKVYVIQVRWLHASMQSTNLYDIHLMLYVQSWTPDDGRKYRPKHVVWPWWLVDRAPWYNFGWSPTWCTQFLFIYI